MGADLDFVDKKLAAIESQIVSLQKEAEELRLLKTLHAKHVTGALPIDLPSPMALAFQKRSTTTKDKVLEVARELMSDGRSVHTRDLLRLLAVRGIDVGGTDKVLTLSAILNKSQEFVANRKIGWSLKKERLESVGADKSLV